MNLTREELARYHRQRAATMAQQRDPRHRALMAQIEAEIRAARQRRNATTTPRQAAASRRFIAETHAFHQRDAAKAKAEQQRLKRDPRHLLCQQPRYVIANENMGRLLELHARRANW